MIDLKYSLVIEATSDPNFFAFFSPDLEGFTGVGHSVEDCLYKAKWGMEEHVALLADQNLQVHKLNSNPTVIVRNEASLAPAAYPRMVPPDEEELACLQLLSQNLSGFGFRSMTEQFQLPTLPRKPFRVYKREQAAISRHTLYPVTAMYTLYSVTMIVVGFRSGRPLTAFAFFLGGVPVWTLFEY